MTPQQVRICGLRRRDTPTGKQQVVAQAKLENGFSITVRVLCWSIERNIAIVAKCDDNTIIQCPPEALTIDQSTADYLSEQLHDPELQRYLQEYP